MIIYPGYSTPYVGCVTSREELSTGRPISQPVVCKGSTYVKRAISFHERQSSNYTRPPKLGEISTSILTQRSSTDSVFSNISHQDSVLEEGLESYPELSPISNEEKLKKIAMELFTTEERYVERLELLNVSFREVLNGSDDNKPVLPEQVTKQIFSNINEIHLLNKTLLESLQERLKKWEEDPRLGDVMTRFAPFLKLYSSYVADFDTANAVLNEYMTKDKRFAALIHDFEKGTSCGNLKISHFMLEPVQRLPRYKLLLEDYLKCLPSDALDRKQTENALKIITEAADHANSKIKQLENFNELLSIQRSLLDYSEDLIQPHRFFIKKGCLGKVSRRNLQQRMFFLFSDVLLHTLPYGSNYKVRDQMDLYSMNIEEPELQPFPNSFNIFATSRSLTVSASSPEEKQDWKNAIQDAIDRIRQNTDSRKKYTSSSSTLLDFPNSEDTEDPQSFGSKAPLWLPDSSVTMCKDCAEQFTLVRRRHHCRGCGKIVCAACSKSKVYLQYLAREDRVCNSCNIRSSVAASLMKENNPESPDSGLSNSVLDKPDSFVNDTVYHGYVKVKNKWNFEKKWILLKRDFNLYMFNAHEDVKPYMTIQLPCYSIETNEDKDKLKFRLSFIEENRKSLTENVSPTKLIIPEGIEFRAENEDDFVVWVDLISKAIQKDLTLSC